MNEKDYIEELKKGESETQSLYSQNRKPERERKVVLAFLRCIGVPFSEDEIQEGEQEPIDVVFRDSNFQLTDLHGGGKPFLDSKKRENSLSVAKNIPDLLEPWVNPEPISYEEISREITTFLLENKAGHYSPDVIEKLNILVHVCLSGRYLWPLEPISNHQEELAQQGWRSVSMLFIPYGCVLTARDAAPKFITNHNGQILNEWKQSDGWYEFS